MIQMRERKTKHQHRRRRMGMSVFSFVEYVRYILNRIMIEDMSADEDAILSGAIRESRWVWTCHCHHTGALVMITLKLSS